MILYEYEGKEILKNAGIKVPPSQLIESSEQDITLDPPLVLKAQVLSGKRADAGGILFADTKEDAREKLKTLLNSTINNEKVEKVLVEKKADIKKEFYLSISYDTDFRAPILSLSEVGGTGIEERGADTFPINPLNPDQDLPDLIDKSLLQKLIGIFFSQDCTLLEINPLIKTSSGEWMALDAKIKLDDTALVRHKDWNFSSRGVSGHTPTKRELDAKLIDEGDYRGVAGSAFFDLPGDIAIMSSGGGASLVAMDALIKVGGAPANFTEYSGNPPKEKVLKLTKVVLSKPDLHGLWVVGGVANFTDVYETLSGIIEGLRQIKQETKMKLDFPIVIRRGGPRDKEAFEMLRQVKDFDLHLYGQETSIPQSAEIIAKLAKEYAQKENNS